MNFSVIILAAGEGTRMKSDKPKVLQQICGKPMISYVLNAVLPMNPDKVVAVVGHRADDVKEVLPPSVEVAYQTAPRGTGHAVLAAQDAFGDYRGSIVVLCGDSPFISAATIRELVESREREKAAVSMLTFTPPDITRYGRIIRNGNGEIHKIIEEKDATAEELAITEVNAGTYCFDGPMLYEGLPQISDNNKAGEYYLTDMIGLLKNRGERIAAVKAGDWWEGFGVDTHEKLTLAWRHLNQKLIKKFMGEGVAFIDNQAVWLDSEVTIARGTVVHPGTIMQGKTEIGENCIIGPHVRIKDSQVNAEARIEFAVIDDCRIGSGANLGPYCRLRGESVISDQAKVGTFVEIKKSRIGKKSKVPHLSYIGDTIMGERVNIGAGSITCNYDGVKKNTTIIEDDVFIGSDTMLVAPVKIGKGAFTGAGSVIKKDVEAESTVVGMPARKIPDQAQKKRRK